MSVPLDDVSSGLNATALLENGDGRVFRTIHCSFTKEVLAKGRGFSKPLLESECNFQHVRLQLEQEELASYISIRDECMNKLSCSNNMESITIGKYDNVLSKSLETMLMTMKMGETSCFHVKWKPSFPKEILVHNNNVETCTDSDKEDIIILVLHNFTDTTPIWQLGPEDKYELSLQHKTKGTSFFKEDNFESAFFQYSVALKYIISVSVQGDLSENQKQKYKDLRCACYFNLAACQLKSANYEGVIDNCSKGLALEGWNVKGLYRRAQAHKNLGKFDLARSDLIKIVKKEPRNKTAADLLESMMPSQLENDDSDISRS